MRLICAAAPALPFIQEKFLRAYSDNRRESVSLSIETSPIAGPIQKLAEVADWAGTATELLQLINKDTSDEVRKDKHWPKNAQTLSTNLRRVAPVLRQAGVDVNFETQGHEKRKVIRIAKKPVQPSDRIDRTDVLFNGSNDLSAVAASAPQPSECDRSEELAAPAAGSRSQGSEE